MYTILGLLFLLGASIASNPGVKIQLNQAGLDYAKSIGLGVLNQEVSGLSLPDFTGSSSIFSYQVTSLSIQQFNAPSSQASIGLQPPSNLNLQVGGMTAYISGNYEVKVGSGWFTITKSGQVTAGASSVSFGQSIGVLQNGGKPQLSAGACSVNIGSLDIQFHGDIIDDIVNLFSGDISDYVKGQLNGVICQQIASVITTDANQELAGIPTSINVYEGFNIDYSLTTNPVVESGDIYIPMLGLFWYTGHHDDAGIPQAGPLGAVTSPNNMVCVMLSGAEVIGSMGYATQVSGMLHLTLDSTLLQTYGVSKYLACQCADSQCVGGFIPQIQTQCGAGGTVQIAMSSTAAPSASVNASGAFVSFAGDLDFQGVLPGGNIVELFTAHITLGAVIPSTLSFQGWKITGQIAIFQATLSIVSSNVGQIDGAGLQQMWQIAMLTVVEGELNKVAASGIQLPNIPDVNIQNPNLVFGPGTLQVCFDVQFTGSTQH